MFDRKVTWRLHIEMMEAKAFRTFIRVYSLFKSDRLSANIGQGEANLRKYKRLKLGRGQAYDRSSV
jgi:hypothetical protein